MTHFIGLWAFRMATIFSYVPWILTKMLRGNIIMIPILQVRELRHREVQALAQSHRRDSEFLFVGWSCVNPGCSFMQSLASSFLSASCMSGTVLGWHGVQQGKRTRAGMRSQWKWESHKRRNQEPEVTGDCGFQDCWEISSMAWESSLPRSTPCSLLYLEQAKPLNLQLSLLEFLPSDSVCLSLICFSLLSSS